MSGQAILPRVGEQSSVLWGPLGKGLPSISLHYPFHLSSKSIKCTFLLALPYAPSASSSQKKLSLALDPIWGQNPTSLETVNLKVGIKGKESTEGWKKRKVNSQGSRLLGKSSDVAPKTPTTLSPGLCSYGLLVFFTTVPGTRQCHSTSAGASCLGSNPGSAPY